ncbi:hypothetical protein ACIOD2_32395 [Amycolatopsis sp. NPDC088138]|uniref:hypothetical protein n=1 Tax=Amycolatopsis sp. NPDC088138 TaxID=3363938 RepID=UPI003804E8F1
MAFDLGDPVPLTVTITDADDQPTNATSVTLTITLPDGTTDTPTPTNPSTGVYAVDYLPTQVGLHQVKWVSEGPGSAFSDVFDVRAGGMTIVSLADVKRQLSFTGSVRDDEARWYAEAVTGVIERHLGQAVVRRTRVEEHCVRSGLVLNWTPVVSLTSMALVDGTYTWDVGSLHCSPAGVVTSPLGVAPYGTLRVTYLAGMASIPAEYGLAAEIIVQHLWQTKRPEKGAGNRGALADSMGYQQAGFAIPNRAVELLGSGLPGIA